MVPWVSLQVMEQGGRREQARKRWAMGAPPPLPIRERESQPASPTIAGNDGFPCMSRGPDKSSSCRGNMGKRRRPRPIIHHASIEAAGFGGPRRSALDPLALPRSQARARLGPGGYYRRPGNGGPQTCLPANRGVAEPAGRTAHLHQQSIQDPREADDARLPLEWPSQAGSRGAEISRRGKPHEALVM